MGKKQTNQHFEDMLKQSVQPYSPKDQMNINKLGAIVNGVAAVIWWSQGRIVEGNTYAILAFLFIIIAKLEERERIHE